MQILHNNLARSRSHSKEYPRVLSHFNVACSSLHRPPPLLRRCESRGNCRQQHSAKKVQKYCANGWSTSSSISVLLFALSVGGVNFTEVRIVHRHKKKTGHL